MSAHTLSRLALMGLVALLLAASDPAAETIASFEDGLPGKVTGATDGPTFGACLADELFAIPDHPGDAGLVEARPGLRPTEGQSMLLLSTHSSDLGADDLDQTRWQMQFTTAEAGWFDLDYRFGTEDRPDFGDYFAILVDGRVIACGDAAGSGLKPRGKGFSLTAWLQLPSHPYLYLEPGLHLVEALVGDGTDRTGDSVLYLDNLRLTEGPAGDHAPSKDHDCVDGEPYPPEDVDEIPNVNGVSLKSWTFDDNRFCAAGGISDSLECQRNDPPTNPNPNPVPAPFDYEDEFFEMYVVADCGDEMHVPLNDVESGCINIFDEDGNPVPFNVNNGDGFDEDGGTSDDDFVCWEAEDCDGQFPAPCPPECVDSGGICTNCPQGPGDRHLMDVEFRGSPNLCGVFTLRFKSWAGCIWDLYTNCTGDETEQFDIYRDFCEAQHGANPLPELVVQNLETVDGGDCDVDYCVDVKNIGCARATSHVLFVENEIDFDDVPVGDLDVGEVQTYCGTLEVADTGSFTTTLVRATADSEDDVAECSESPSASSCDPNSGGDTILRRAGIDCGNPPTCDAGGPYTEDCTAASGATEIQLDGSGSEDPGGATLSYEWTTDCPNASFDDNTLESPVLSLPDVTCGEVCSVFLTVSNFRMESASCSSTVTVDDMTPPVLTCPDSSVLECGEPGSSVEDREAWVASATATDECDPNVVVDAELILQNIRCPERLVYRFTATDECGNVATCDLDETESRDRSWEVADTRPPVVSAPDDVFAECGQGDVISFDEWLASATAEDACTGMRPVLKDRIEDSEGDCPGTERHVVDFYATDVCGNESEKIRRTYELRDSLPPQLIGVPADVTVDCDAVPPPADVRAEDDCDRRPSLDFEETRTDGSCDQDYTLTRTWTSVDACGNQSQATQVVTVTDTVAPTLDGVPPDATVDCDAVPSPPPVSATDDCAMVVVEFTETREDGPCPSSYVLVRTWSADDGCGNIASETQRLSVEDRRPPQLSGAPADQTVSCDEIPAPVTLTASDDCDGDVPVGFSESRTDGPCIDSFTLTRTWTAVDECGNEASHVQTVEVEDTTPPAFGPLPADETVPCDAVPAAATVTATDDCDPDVDVDFSETRADGPCPDSYTLSRTWTATDNCGNQTIHVQTVEVEDTTPPTFGPLPSDDSVSCDAVPLPAAVTATDDCDADVSVELVESRTDGPCPDTYTLTRTWTATDNCDNRSVHVQTIEVEDTMPPVFGPLPADQTVSCDAVPTPADVTASDDCDADVLLEFDEVRTDGPCPDTYTLTRTWTATDNCDNQSVHVQSIEVEDTTPPFFGPLPADATVACDAVPSPADVSASDDCDADVLVEFDEDRTDGPCPDTYTLTRTWTATDNCDNQSVHVQTIEVEDTTPPAFGPLPADQTVACDAVPSPAHVSASDDCDADVLVEFDEERTDGPCPDTYTLTRTWTATDNCDNQSVHVQTIEVEDTTPPVFGPLPSDETVSCESVPAPASVDASDDCDADVLVEFDELRTDGPCPDTYTLTRTWTATDNCDNQSVHVQTVEVVDNTPPVVMVPAEETVECDAVPPPGIATVSDNCDPMPALSLLETRIDGPCADAYTLDRTWTGVDRCGNSASATQLVHVVDTTPPIPVAVLLPRLPMPPTSVTSGVRSAGEPVPPASPRSARSTCSAPNSGTFEVQCSATDNCDPDPTVEAVLLAITHEVSDDGECLELTEIIPVACGEVFELRLAAPPCPASSAASPASARPVLSVTSEGVKIISAESLLLEVTATDRCGNEASATADPTEVVDPDCPDYLEDGTCCPVMAAPSPGPCPVDPCGLDDSTRRTARAHAEDPQTRASRRDADVSSSMRDRPHGRLLHVERRR